MKLSMYLLAPVLDCKEASFCTRAFTCLGVGVPTRSPEPPAGRMMLTLNGSDDIR